MTKIGNIPDLGTPRSSIWLRGETDADTTLVPLTVLANLVNKAVELIGTIEELSVDLVATNRSMAEGVKLPKGFLIHALTSRELAVLQLMAHGLNNTAIAEQLTITKKSVENYINRIYQTLNLTHENNIYPRVMAVLNYIDYTQVHRTKPYNSTAKHTDNSPMHTSPMANRFHRAA